ncbi:MAG: GNAT family N-acetyltransferase, partial [Thermoplasmata archaeon]|nr:GNAT family N-acetyltransferase [Thermoplasmata archaeon]
MDYKAITRIWKQCFSIKLRPVDSKDILNRLVEHSPGLFLVAEYDNRIVGTVFAGHDGRQATIHRLAVLPEHQQKGIGKALMTDLLKRLELLK